MVTEKDFVGMTDFSECLAQVRGTTRAMSMVGMPTPDELHAIYARGFQGVKPDSVTVQAKGQQRAMMASMPRFYDIFPWAKDIGKGKVNCPYAAIGYKDKQWGVRDAQARGDCTVHGTRNACSLDYGLDALFGETEYLGPLAVENIYRSRGFNGDGWSCEAPCSYVGPEGKGGLLYRKRYEGPNGESVDLTEYNPSWEGNGKAGNPAWLVTESLKNKVKWVIPIGTPEEYRDAIAIGFGINVCSGQGYSSTTDDNGVANAQGSWSHSMAHVACVDTDAMRTKYSDMIGGIQNSWGSFNTIKGKPPGSPNMPPGMFYSRFKTIQSMLNGNDSFAMCSVQGWNANIWNEFVMMPQFDDKSRKAYSDKLTEYLRSSTAQDYYVQRAEKLEEFTKEAVETGLFTAI
jgi:hypothetical protein